MVYIIRYNTATNTTHPKFKTKYNFCSFKERGVLNTLTQLNVDQKRTGVISASIGNYGIALSCIATKLGIPCIVVMPMNSPIHKISKVQEFGAKVMLHGTNMQDAMTQAMLLRKDKKMLYISGWDFWKFIWNNCKIYRILRMITVFCHKYLSAYRNTVIMHTLFLIAEKGSRM